jgi:hypothetical protein
MLALRIAPFPGNLRHFAIIGPAGGDEFRSLGRTAMQQHHAGMLGESTAAYPRNGSRGRPMNAKRRCAARRQAQGYAPNGSEQRPLRIVDQFAAVQIGVQVGFEIVSHAFGFDLTEVVAGRLRADALKLIGVGERRVGKGREVERKMGRNVGGLWITSSAPLSGR